MGSRLVMEEGDPVLIIPQLAKKIDAKFVFGIDQLNLMRLIAIYK